ncbi:MAG: hypothetical protein ACTSPG_07065 [Candidatus Hodarchaeales archaeon]
MRLELADESIETKFEQLTMRLKIISSFKESQTQTLNKILSQAFIVNLEEKKHIIEEIYRLIREGVIYVPKGLPELVEKGSKVNTNEDTDMGVRITLIWPLESIFSKTQKEINHIIRVRSALLR